MFRAVGLRSPLLSPAWTGAWRRIFLPETKRSLFRNLQSQQHASLHMLRNIPRQSAYRSGGPFTKTQCRGFRFSSWRRNTTQNGTQEKLALSVLDFPFCFLLVRIVGTDTIGKIEHYVVSTVKRFIPESVRQKWHEYWQSIKSKEVETMGNDNISDKVEMAGWGVEEAQERNKEEASLGTQLALAYAIHKSFIFLRVPLTAAITPKVVKVLRSWGWNIGKRVSR